MAGISGEPDDLLAGAHHREQVLRFAVEIVRDDGVRRVEDVLGRPVILLEQDHLRVREVAFELGDVADVGPTERIDRLVAVAHDGERRPGDSATRVELHPGVCGHVVRRDRPHELPDERVLGVVRVLVLIDENMPEPALVERRDIRKRAKEVDGLGDDVVEVERVRPAKCGGVPLEDLDEPGLFRVVHIDAAGEGIDVGQLVLELRDATRHPAGGEADRVCAELLDDPFEKGTLVGGVVDGETLLHAHRFSLPTQDARAGGMERRDPHALGRIPDERFDALPHLGGRLVRERDREDLARPGLAGLEQAGDATGEHARLARARTRHDQQRLPTVDDSLTLLGIEAVEQGVVDPASCRAAGLLERVKKVSHRPQF